MTHDEERAIRSRIPLGLSDSADVCVVLEHCDWLKSEVARLSEQADAKHDLRAALAKSDLQNERLLHEVCGTKAFLKRLAEAKVPDFSEVAATLLEYMHTGASEKQKGEGPKPYTGYKDEGVDLS